MQARWHWGQALIDIKPDLEALEAADPYSVGIEEARRERLMAQDRKGYLRQAREAAARAVGLARSSEETYQANLWLALIEGDRGHYTAELQSARRLIALRPHDPISLGTLRRAAQHNGLKQLARQAEAEYNRVTGGGEAP
jgi:hypothetical protein